MNKQVVILLGSANDKSYFKGAEEVFGYFKIAYEIKVLSAHRTPDALREYIVASEKTGVEVFIGAAGGAAHLAGVLAAHTLRPVIGVPLPSSPLNGLDALLSTVQMPGGIPVATMSIGEWGAKNAAIFAVQILSVSEPELRDKLKLYRQEMRDKLLAGA
jgi:phosphoribosylaminoimidazole carboxylase PurE protein